MARMIRLLLLACLTLLLVASCDSSPSSPEPPTPTSAPTATPVVPVPETEQASEIELPQGFSAFVVAEGFSQPTALAANPQGALFLTESGGRVLRLEDGNGDGLFEGQVIFAEDLPQTTGIAFSPDGELYVSSQGQVVILSDTDGDFRADTTDEIVTGLPTGRHQNNGIAFGPDGKLYITNGSTCNECDEDDERSATILQANPDGTELRVYASGLRNPYDLVFDPDGRLWATDNGSDPPCNTIDELNLVDDGGDYGWPYGPACDSFQSGTPPAGDLGFNTASTGIDYYGASQFPETYQGNLFLTLWGSLPFAPEPGGHVLVRAVIEETPAGPTASVEEFATGLQNPIDVLVDTDGTLLVLDFGAGRLYRIVYLGG